MDANKVPADTNPKGDNSTPDNPALRPRIKKYAKKTKFCVGDKVVVVSGGRSLEGPFRVDTVTDSGAYVLCTLAGEDVNSGREYEESELEFA